MGVSGTYKITVNAMGKSVDGSMKLKADGKKLAGRVSIGGQDIKLENGTVDGQKLSGQVQADTPVGNLKLKVSAKVDGKQIAGKLSALLGSAEFEGKRVGD